MLCYLFRAKDSLDRLFLASRCCEAPHWIKNLNGTYSPGNRGSILIPEFQTNIGTITSIETKKDLNDITKDVAYFTSLECSDCLVFGCYAFKALDSSGNFRIYFNCCSNPEWLISRSNSSYFEPANSGDYLRINPGWQTEKGEILFVRNKTEIIQLVENILIDDGVNIPFYYYKYNKYLYSNPGTWQACQDQAVSLGGNLVSILNQSEQDFIINSFGNSEVFWIGLIPSTPIITEEFETVSVAWVDGNTYSFQNWALNEYSTNFSGDNNTRFLLNYSQYNRGKWSRILYTSGLGKFYLSSQTGTWEDCQFQAISIYGNLVKIDSLSKESFINSIFNTSVRRWIGLSDRLNDGVFRWTDGTTPIYTNWTPGQPVNVVGAIQHVHTNHLAPGKWRHTQNITYITTIAGTWEDSQAIAVSMGGNLVTIKNSFDQANLNNIYGTTTRYWIGLTDRETEGVFKWISGYPVTYTNWATGEPNQFSGINENYVEMNFPGSNGRWNDTNNNQNHQGIVELPFDAIGGIIEIDNILIRGIIKIPHDLNYCDSCLNYKNFPNIKANRSTIQLPDYQNFLQSFGNTDYFAKSAQSVGANAEINLFYELLNKEQKQTLENFYNFSKNQSFLIDLNILRIPQNIKDLITNWNTLTFIFKSEPIIKPRVISINKEVYDINIILVSNVS